MKVVLFCGGFGMRLREYSEAIPKPMVNIGYRPILWHIMKYYAHFGHTEFILCLGWKADVIKQYFLDYDECLSNDFVLSGGGSNLRLINSDIHSWNITFVDTGVTANIGERLRAVQPYLEGEETFLANYSDGLTDLELPTLIDFHHEKNAVATFLSVRPTQTCHQIHCDSLGQVHGIRPIGQADVWINAGFFILQQEIFDYLHAGDELVEQPFQRLIEQQRLWTYQYDGFYGCMDTFKEKQNLDEMYARGDTPWELWRHPARAPATAEETVTEYARQSPVHRNGRTRPR